MHQGKSLMNWVAHLSVTRFRDSRVRGCATYPLVLPSVFRCVAPDHGNGPDSWRNFKFVDILVDKRLALRIPCHPNLLRLWRSLRALHCRNENVVDFLCLKMRLLVRGKMRVINLGIFFRGAALKFSRRVPNEHRLRLYDSARCVLTPAKGYRRRAGDDDGSDEYCEDFELHEGGVP